METPGADDDGYEHALGHRGGGGALAQDVIQQQCGYHERGGRDDADGAAGFGIESFRTHEDVLSGQK